MSGFLLDTNILSELRKPRPEANVVRLVAAQSEDDLFVSDVTFAEIRFGIEQLADADRRAHIATWLDHELRPLFAGRTLAIDEDVLLRWRLLLDAGKRRGHVFGQLDLLIGACAAENGLIVVSRDVTHFKAAGVPVLEPWKAIFIPSNGVSINVDDLANPSLLSSLLAQRG
ncbi:PIN domain-containing protein [Sphingomonas histidinilytica]|uniref:type II toxin-antitoxin system VapC family toxin n=1 Tax=Rhizorhabdus histidinilytica TaxID=439228 RepID=UPI001AD9DB42|nr:type II toxin-antitoxin system VapC family toxin [Rhizorhabdus histidinilytica]MBO9375576.1 PIN domain-containing protein [Rhizorhabdus histidinilytica]